MLLTVTPTVQKAVKSLLLQREKKTKSRTRRHKRVRPNSCENTSDIISRKRNSRELMPDSYKVSLIRSTYTDRCCCEDNTIVKEWSCEDSSVELVVGCLVLLVASLHDGAWVSKVVRRSGEKK